MKLEIEVDEVYKMLNDAIIVELSNKVIELQAIIDSLMVLNNLEQC
jgi:hypothetical protein